MTNEGKIFGWGAALMAVVVVLAVIGPAFGDRLNREPVLGCLLFTGALLFFASLGFFLLGSLRYGPLGASDASVRRGFRFSLGCVGYALVQVPIWSLMTGRFPPDGFTDGQAVFVTAGVVVSILGAATPGVIILFRLSREPKVFPPKSGSAAPAPIQFNPNVSNSPFSFPVFAVSPAGWTKTASDLEELIEASPDDPLDEWQHLRIYDSAGRCFRARRAFRLRPASCLGHWLSRFLNQSIFVGFELDPPVDVPAEELRRILIAAGELPLDFPSSSHRALLLATK